MSENSKLNYKELLKKTAVTYEQTVERLESEKQRPQIDRFRMGEDGTYNVRILPLAPYLTAEGEIDETKKLRPSFEYPLKQMFLDIKGAPKKAGGKPSVINVPIIQATQEGVGKSVDLIDLYRNLARNIYADDKEVVELVNKGRYEKGLRWQNQRVMYVINLDATKHPVLLWQASAAQYHDFAERQKNLWGKLLQKNEDAEDPLAGFGSSYALEITRKTENKKTDYSFTIDMTNDYELSDEDMDNLFNSPRIPDVIYRYTRYQMEATILFLQQYDEEHELDIMEEQEMKDAIEKLKGELDPTDQSHFDLASAGEKGEGGSNKLTIDVLNDRYDALLDKGLADDSEEGTDLREDIRAFVEENDLDIKLKHSMSTEEMLDLVEEALENAPKGKAAEEKNDEPEKKEAPEKKEESEKKDDDPEPTSRRRRAARPTADDEDNNEPEKKDEPEAGQGDGEQTEGRTRRRRSR